MKYNYAKCNVCIDFQFTLVYFDKYRSDIKLYLSGLESATLLIDARAVTGDYFADFR